MPPGGSASSRAVPGTPFVAALPLGGARAVRLQDDVHERVRVAVPQAKFALQHVPNLAVLRQAARLHGFRQLRERLARLLLDVRKLRGDGFVHADTLRVRGANLYHGTREQAQGLGLEDHDRASPHLNQSVRSQLRQRP